MFIPCAPRLSRKAAVALPRPAHCAMQSETTRLRPTGLRNNPLKFMGTLLLTGGWVVQRSLYSVVHYCTCSLARTQTDVSQHTSRQRQAPSTSRSAETALTSAATATPQAKTLMYSPRRKHNTSCNLYSTSTCIGCMGVWLLYADGFLNVHSVKIKRT